MPPSCDAVVIFLFLFFLSEGGGRATTMLKRPREEEEKEETTPLCDVWHDALVEDVRRLIRIFVYESDDQDALALALTCRGEAKARYHRLFLPFYTWNHHHCYGEEALTGYGWDQLALHTIVSLPEAGLHHVTLWAGYVEAQFSGIVRVRILFVGQTSDKEIKVGDTISVERHQLGFLPESCVMARELLEWRDAMLNPPTSPAYKKYRKEVARTVDLG